MAITLNHIIVLSKDAKEGAQFLADIFGLPGTSRYSHFEVVTINGISFDYATSRVGPVQRQHIAFLVSDQEFDEIFARIKERNVSYWADPRREKPNEICPDDGGRGIYFADPSDHNFEIITRPYSRDLATRNAPAVAARDASGRWALAYSSFIGRSRPMAARAPGWHPPATCRVRDRRRPSAPSAR